MHLLKLVWYLVSEVRKLARLLFGGEKCAACAGLGRLPSPFEGAMIHSFGFKKCEPCSDSSSPFIQSSIDPLSALLLTDPAHGRHEEALPRYL